MKTSILFLGTLLSILSLCFAEEDCQDTNGSFEINRESISNPGVNLTRKCGWLSSSMDRINRYCDRADVKLTCPFTCCECGNCVLPTPSPTVPPPTCVDGVPPSKGGKGKGGTPCPTSSPSVNPSETPTALPSFSPSKSPSVSPSETPTVSPSFAPSTSPSVYPSETPTSTPSALPSTTPISVPSSSPSATPSIMPSDTPTTSPSDQPSMTPSVTPSSIPTAVPSPFPSSAPSPCQDTKGSFEINRESFTPGENLTKKCGWLAEKMDRINRYCDREDVKDTCPFTCCECDNCVLPTPSPTALPTTAPPTAAPSKGKGSGTSGTIFG